MDGFFSGQRLDNLLGVSGKQDKKVHFFDALSRHPPSQIFIQWMSILYWTSTMQNLIAHLFSGFWSILAGAMRHVPALFTGILRSPQVWPVLLILLLVEFPSLIRTAHLVIEWLMVNG